MTTPRFGLLFHFTHVDHLPLILEEGALLCDSLLHGTDRLIREAGHQGIKERRRRMPVPCSPGGMVGDYVPFYYAARSPMMLTISSGNVPTFTGDYRDLVYLVSEVDLVVDAGLPFVISDRNAALGHAEFSNDPSVLGDLRTTSPSASFVDWSVMDLTYWNNTAQDPDRQERRMAEFLVYERMPLEALLGVGVHRDEVGEVVEHMFADAGWETTVETRPGWYY